MIPATIGPMTGPANPSRRAQERQSFQSIRPSGCSSRRSRGFEADRVPWGSSAVDQIRRWSTSCRLTSPVEPRPLSAIGRQAISIMLRRQALPCPGQEEPLPKDRTTIVFPAYGRERGPDVLSSRSGSGWTGSPRCPDRWRRLSPASADLDARLVELSVRPIGAGARADDDVARVRDRADVCGFREDLSVYHYLDR